MNKRNKWILVGVTALVLLALGAAAGLYYHDQTKTRTVRGSSSVEFVTTQAPGKKKRPHRVVLKTPWPHVRLRRGAHSRRGRLSAPAAVQAGLDGRDRLAASSFRLRSATAGSSSGTCTVASSRSAPTPGRSRGGRTSGAASPPGPAVKGRTVVVALTNPYPCLGHDSRDVTARLRRRHGRDDGPPALAPPAWA